MTAELLPESRLSSAPLDENAKELARLLGVNEHAAAVLLAVGFNQCRERVKEANLSARPGVGVDAEDLRSCQDALQWADERISQLAPPADSVTVPRRFLTDEMAGMANRLGITDEGWIAMLDLGQAALTKEPK